MESPLSRLTFGQLPPLMLILIGASFAISPHVAHAAYVLEQGVGTAICERYTAGLNASAPKAPLITERPLRAETGLRRPVWGRIPDKMDVPTDAIIEFLWNRDANPAWSLTVPHESSAWRGTPAQIEIAKQNFFRQIGNTDAGYAQGVSFELINVDIDNDGRPEPLVRFNYYHDGKLLLVLTPDGSEIDHHKSELVLRHPEWGAKSSPAFRKQDSDTRLRPIEDALHDAIYDVFSYDGKHYFDLWWLEDPARTRTERPTDSHWRLSVFQASGGRTTRLCRLRFES